MILQNYLVNDPRVTSRKFLRRRKTMKFRKTIVLLFAVLMGQMVAASDVDLYRGLLFWITDQRGIEGNELRQTSLPLSTDLDGSKAITFSVADLSRRVPHSLRLLLCSRI